MAVLRNRADFFRRPRAPCDHAHDQTTLVALSRYYDALTPCRTLHTLASAFTGRVILSSMQPRMTCDCIPVFFSPPLAFLSARRFSPDPSRSQMVSYRSLVSVPSASTMNLRAVVGIRLRNSCACSPSRPLADRFSSGLSPLSYGPLTRLMPYSVTPRGVFSLRCPPSVKCNSDGHGAVKHRFWLHLGPNWPWMVSQPSGFP